MRVVESASSNRSDEMGFQLGSWRSEAFVQSGRRESLAQSQVSPLQTDLSNQNTVATPNNLLLPSTPTSTPARFPKAPPVPPAHPSKNMSTITPHVLKQTSGENDPSVIQWLKLTAKDISSIGSSLESCIRLRELNLSFNSISVVEGLGTLSLLCKLDLSVSFAPCSFCFQSCLLCCVRLRGPLSPRCAVCVVRDAGRFSNQQSPSSCIFRPST